jgi:tripartite ATP-independent transporter DctM subunit
MTTLFLVITLVCAACGAPLFVVFGSLAMLLFNADGINVQAVIIEMLRMASAPTLVAIPLFTFAGYLMAESSSPQRMVNLYRALFGWMPGGLAICAFIACAFFTSFNGASGVTIIALGGLLYPLLIKEGYPERFSMGLLTTGGSLGLLFPPSLPLILYALVGQVNVDALFLAGTVPGILLIALLSMFSIRAGNKYAVLRQPFEWKKVWPALKEAGWIIPLPFIILIGIYGGLFAASEAAAVTVVYVLIVHVFIYKDINWRKDVPRIASDSMILVGGVLIILGCALGFTNYLVDEQVPMKILELMRQFIHSKLMFLLILNVFLLVVGCLMDIFSAIIIVVPLIAPIAQEFGVNPIHLGIIFLTNLEIGYIHPPLGLNLFISSLRFKKSILQLSLSVLPFLAILLIALAIITYVPGLSLWLVHLFGRG